MLLTKISGTLNVLIMPSLEVWFSYETPIGFVYGGCAIYTKNRWSNTTGKHIGIFKRDNAGLKLEEYDNDVFKAMLSNLESRLK